MAWTDDFDLAIRVSRRVVLSGNTLDFFLGSAPGKASLNLTLRQWLMQRLSSASLGYSTVIDLSPDQGPENLHGQEWDALLKEAGAPNGASPAGGLGGDSWGPRLEQLGRIFGANRSPVAALFMNAELLFANTQAVTADAQLALIRQITNLIPPRDGGGQCPGSVLVLVFNNPAAIPAQIFTSDPEMRSVHVGQPSSEERRQWLQRSMDERLLRGGAPLDQKELDALVAATKGEPLKTLWGVSVLSRQQAAEGDAQALLRLYRHGKHKDPWRDGEFEGRLSNLASTLPQELVGQDEAVRAVLQALDRAVYAGGSGENKPRGALFFAGPTGTGKSLMAKLVAKALFGSKDRVTPFDMSEYRGEFGHTKLIGAAPGFVGYEQGGRLIEAVRQDPFQVLLFDEFEKASPRLYDLFLQIIDEARCTDSHGRVAYFGQSFIIFTSNIGGSKYPDGINLVDPAPNDFREIRKHYERAVRECFYNSVEQGGIDRPELYHRIGEENIIAFNPLIGPVRTQVARATIRQVVEEMQEQAPESPLTVDMEELADFVLTEVAADGEGGGRVIHRTASRLIRDAIVDLRKQTRAVHASGTIEILVDRTNDILMASWRR